MSVIWLVKTCGISQDAVWFIQYPFPSDDYVWLLAPVQWWCVKNSHCFANPKRTSKILKKRFLSLIFSSFLELWQVQYCNCLRCHSHPLEGHIFFLQKQVVALNEGMTVKSNHSLCCQNTDNNSTWRQKVWGVPTAENFLSLVLKIQWGFANVWV